MNHWYMCVWCGNTYKVPSNKSFLDSSSSSKFYFQQNTTMEQYQEKENTL